MNTENFIIDNSSQGKVIKYISAIPPNIDRSIFPEAFIVKAINLSNLSRFVITSN